MAERGSRRRLAAVDADPVESLLEECARVYGPDLLAYLLGAGADVPLAKWRLEAEGSSGRLLACRRILRAFTDPRLARAWMRRASPTFGGRTPAWAVRTGDPELLAFVEREARSAPKAGG